MEGRQTRNSLSAACFSVDDGHPTSTVASTVVPSSSACNTPPLVNSPSMPSDMLEMVRLVASQAALAAVNSLQGCSLPSSTTATTTNGNSLATATPPSSVLNPSLANHVESFLAAGSSLGFSETTSPISATGTSVSYSVPEFLSTFSMPTTNSTLVRMATPMTVSSLPSLSSSLFDQHFVVGPGFSPIPPKIVNQILAGKFTDLSELLTPNLLQAQTEPQLLFDGRVVLTSSDKKPRRRIEDVVSWVEAFTIFMLVIASSFPHRWRDLTAYKLLILRTYRQFGGQVWLNYDLAFRQHAAATKLTDWSAMNVQLFNFHAAGTTNHSYPGRVIAQGEATGSHSSDIICRSWNRGQCSSPYKSCKFAHKCSSCNGDHRAADCQSSASRRRSRSPSYSRDNGRSKKR